MLSMGCVQPVHDNSCLLTYLTSPRRLLTYFKGNNPLIGNASGVVIQFTHFTHY